MVAPTAAGVAAADFDHFSDTYEQLVSESVRLAGEGVEYFAELKARYLSRVLGPHFRGKVLDFGCGVGLLSRFLLSSLPECQLHGYDPSTASLEMMPLEVSADRKFTSDEKELDSDYDLIVAANVMHHVPRRERQCLVLGLEKRLGETGTLAVFEHNPLNPLTRLAVKQCPFDVGVALLWPQEIRNYCAVAGLVSMRHDYITFFPRGLSWLRPLEPELTWCPLGAQYAVVARKASPSKCGRTGSRRGSGEEQT
jgi:2-polyprenyl-3-methyl-5-hydroxy-6-metoxy-1,4-benzoquinol methylase